LNRVLFVLTALCLAFPAVAQEEDGEAVSSEPQCEVSANWRVVATEMAEAPGMTMDINKRDAGGQPDCNTKDVKPEFTLGGPAQPLWFTSLSSDYLVMFRAADPVGSLVVQNLTDKAIVLDVESDETNADSWGVTYWELKEPANAGNCPQFADFAAQGYVSSIKHEMRFDFAAKTSLSSGKTKCEPRQQ
jgi:hypothetical protein